MLRAEGYLFNVFTPSGSVRLMSDRSAEDFIELALDTSGAAPQVIGRVSRSRGRRRDRRPNGRSARGPFAISPKRTCWRFLLKALEPFVERLRRSGHPLEDRRVDPLALEQRQEARAIGGAPIGFARLDDARSARGRRARR